MLSVFLSVWIPFYTKFSEVPNNLESEMLMQALLELARVERIIIVLHFLCGMELSEIAYLLETDLNSIYVQKCTTIKHLKKILM